MQLQTALMMHDDFKKPGSVVSIPSGAAELMDQTKMLMGNFP